MAERFRVGITADLAPDRGDLLGSIASDLFDPVPGLHYEYMSDTQGEVAPEHLDDYDAVMTLHPSYTRQSLQQAERLALIARWGVGYDMVDVAACTDHDVLLSINRDAVRRPMAEGVVTLLLALTRQLLIKDSLVRTGRWADKTNYPGIGLTGRVFGLIGVGNIGAEILRLLQPFGLRRYLAYDPYARPEAVAGLGVEWVTLDGLLREADFISVNCPLTPETHHLIGAAEIDKMKPDAFLINTARGPVVDLAALTDALQAGRIAGAGLDVFEPEPLPADHPITRLDNVILSPHAIGWTDESVRGNSLGVCESVMSILRGEVPPYVVNPEVIARPGFQAKLATLRERWRTGHES